MEVDLKGMEEEEKMVVSEKIRKAIVETKIIEKVKAAEAPRKVREPSGGRTTRKEKA